MTLREHTGLLMVALLGFLGATAQASPTLTPFDDQAPAGSGHYPALMEQAASLPDHTIYAPATVAAGQKLPVLLWGNGGCIDYGNRYRPLLTEIASHGYLVIANGGMGPKSIESGSEEGMPPPPKNINDPRASSYKQLLSALDWATAQNRTVGGPFQGKVDIHSVAVAGHSCGGLQAIAAAADPRIKTSIIMNSGIWNKGLVPSEDLPVDKGSLAKLHGSVLYLGGDASDIAFENTRDDFSRLQTIPAAWVYHDGISHGGTYFDPNGGLYGNVVIKWLQWHLKGNVKDARMFVGKDCELCRNEKWHITRKNMN